MKKSRRNNRKNRSNDAASEDDDILLKPSSKTFSSLSRENVLAAATCVGIAYLALPLMTGKSFGESFTFQWNKHRKPIQKELVFNPEEFVKSTAGSVEERLMEEWQPGDSIKIKELEGGDRGLFAKWDIRKGQMITSVDFPDLEEELVQEFRTVRPIVQTAMEHAFKSGYGTNWSTLTTGKILSLIKFLIEDSKGEDSVWHSFIESIPQNVTNMAWYWSSSEKQCIVPRPGSESLHDDLKIYHAVMNNIKQNFEPFAEIYSRERAEWAYLMLKTRGFGQYFLPVLHLANHNPLRGISAFILPKTGTAAYIATHNMKRGDPIYTDYGKLTPVVSAEQYGFVEEEPAFFEVPSILEDLLSNEKTKNERLCTREPMKFFGNMSTQVVDAKYGNAGHSTYFKVSKKWCLMFATICYYTLPVSLDVCEDALYLSRQVLSISNTFLHYFF